MGNTRRLFARSLVIAAIGSLASMAARDARAQCCSGATCELVPGWPACDAVNGCVSLDSTAAATGSGPSTDTAFNPGGFSTGHSFAITGRKLVGINNSNGALAFTTTVSSATLDNFPNPVILTADCAGPNCAASTKITNFIASDEGNLYKVVFDISSSQVTTTSANLQRPGCSLDKLKGTPAVQLTAFSNSLFQTAMGDTVTDLVVVGTYYPDQGLSCPGGQNRVYGLRSSDLSTQWVFNITGSQVLGPVTEACALEYYSGGTPAGTVNNAVVCGFNKTGSTPGLIALNTATTLATGTARWAADTIGGVVIRPVIATLGGRRAVYVGTTDGYLRAYSPVNGSFLWTGGVPLVQNGIGQNIWAEFRSGPLQNRIFVVALDGTFRRFIDLGDSGVEEGQGITADATGTVKYTSMAVAAPYNGLNTLYIGRNDGQVQQLSSAYAQQQLQRVGGPTAIVFDPSLDYAPDGTVSHLVVTAGASGSTPGKIARLQLPWCASASGG
jgi:hypothetical protein